MGDYILNSACYKTPYVDAAAARNDLKALLEGLSMLDGTETRLPALRLAVDPWLLHLVEGEDGNFTLGEVAQQLYEHGGHEAATYFDALNTMIPADVGWTDDVIDAALRLSIDEPAEGHANCFERAGEAGLDAVMCVLTGSLLISLERSGHWKVDHLAFKNPSGEFILEHLSSPIHATSLLEARRNKLRSEITTRTFWGARAAAFPRLLFGQDVEDQLQSFDGGLVQLLFSRLADLDNRCQVWQSTGEFPEGRPAITGESDQTMARYRSSRRFRGHDGDVKTFEDHIWVDGLHRIHLLRDPITRTIEIGYVGRHLPTMTYPT